MADESVTLAALQQEEQPQEEKVHTTTTTTTAVLPEGDSEAEGDDAASPSTAVKLQEHSNSNLLKIDTHDKYSTVGAIKKEIIKQLPPPITQAPPLPLFKGLVRIGKNPKNPHIFLAFETEEDRAAAKAHLLTVTYRKHVWNEEPVNARDMQLTHKGKQLGEEDRTRKRGRGDATAASAEVEGGSCSTSSSSSSAAPLGICQWANVPLSEQIERKSHHCLRVMKCVIPPNAVNGFSAYREKFRGVFTTEITEGYRNHVNYTFGLDDQGKPAVGFLAGSLVDGLMHIQPADARAVTTNPLALCIAEVFQKLHDSICERTGGLVTVTERTHGRGFWRRLQVRHNVLGEIMLCLELDTSPSSGLPESSGLTLDAVLHEIVAAVTSDAFRTTRLQPIIDTAKVVSIQYYSHSGTTSCPQDVARTVIYGSATLTEQLCGLSFELGPAAFFQVNTPGMTLMLDKVHSVANLGPKTVLLDLCCGTGTIGLCLAKYVKRVIGIELVASAVENAKINAKRNNISNAAFYAGRIEQMLPDVINSLSKEDREDIVAILDPPRAGVHVAVLKWVRSTAAIHRVVYISCEQKALENDCPGLTKAPTNSYPGIPFTVESGFGVDLFPHTPHVEMVVVLSRKREGRGGEEEVAVATATAAAIPQAAAVHTDAELRQD